MSMPGPSGPVRAAFASATDPDFHRLCDPGRAAVMATAESGSLDLGSPFEVSLVDGAPVVSQLPDLEGSLGSVSELNAHLSPGLPEAFSHSGPSLADDPIVARHLADNWGF